MARIQKREGFIFRDLDFLYNHFSPHLHLYSLLTIEKGQRIKVSVCAFPFTWIPGVGFEMRCEKQLWWVIGGGRGLVFANYFKSLGWPKGQQVSYKASQGGDGINLTLERAWCYRSHCESHGWSQWALSAWDDLDHLWDVLAQICPVLANHQSWVFFCWDVRCLRRFPCQLWPVLFERTK